MFVPISLTIFDSLLMLICHVLDVILNPAILILAIVEGVLCYKSLAMLKKYSKSSADLEKTNVSADVSRKAGTLDISEQVVSKRLLSWDHYASLKNAYTKDLRTYDKFAAIIQLFTLLGILGTVAGLYLSLNDVVAEGQTFSYEGIGFALSSTIWGIAFALIYKFIDSIFAAPKVDAIEARMEAFEKDYEIRAAVVAEKQEQASETPQRTQQAQQAQQPQSQPQPQQPQQPQKPQKPAESRKVPAAAGASRGGKK